MNDTITFNEPAMKTLIEQVQEKYDTKLVCQTRYSRLFRLVDYLTHDDGQILLRVLLDGSLRLSVDNEFPYDDEEGDNNHFDSVDLFEFSDISKLDTFLGLLN